MQNFKSFNLLLILLVLLASSCNPHQIVRKGRTPRTVGVTYMDNVKDTLQTRYRYKFNRVVYVVECSCDGIVSKL